MWERISTKHPRLFDAARHGIFPALFYLLSFCLLVFPLLGKFFSEFWGDRVDGLQNVWNLWWVNLAVRRPDLYPSIWYTNLLHWPFGTTLVGHTLNPFNGYLAVFLLSFLSLRAAYNTIVVFAFVTAGVTMYWLSYYLTRSYWPSLIAGFMFTFSSFHFMHVSAGHLQVVSLEWIPLFLLCWYVLITRPGVLMAIGAAFVLWLVILCDYYFFLYCILGAVLMLCWYAATQKSILFIVRREFAIPLATFAAASALLSGPLVASLLITNYRDALTGAHDAATYSLDLLALLIPSRSWLFSQWTQSYWSRLPADVTENNAFLALPVFAFIGYLWTKRKTLDPAVRQHLYLWSLIAGFFFLLALGPVLHIAGTAVWDRLMPYSLLGRVLPFLSLSGVPARMTVMVVLSTSILSAFALRGLFAQFRAKRFMIFGLLAVLLVETLPAPLATTAVSAPDYVLALENMPDDGGVLNLVKTRSPLQLYYQTIHGKPITFGYLARLPASVIAGDEQLSEVIAAQDYAKLWATYHIRYIVTSDILAAPANPPYITLALVYNRKDAKIYRLGCVCELAH